MPEADADADEAIAVDDDLMLDLFRRLGGAEEAAFRFMLGLVLLRRKRLTFIGVDDDSGDWRLRVVRGGGEELTMRDAKLSEAELADAGERVTDLLANGIAAEAVP